MLPLISPVDQEPGLNSYQNDVASQQIGGSQQDQANQQEQLGEETPLLPRFGPIEIRAGRDYVTVVVVSLLGLILVSGVVIGTYLLIVQDDSENLLPPIETPLQLVSRAQWDPLANSQPVLKLSGFRSNHVIVVQTDTQKCYTAQSCTELLRAIQANVTEHILPYNFAVSSSGQAFEALGWRRPSPLFPEYPSGLVLAFIGNFTEAPPSKIQVDEAKNFFAESVSLQHLKRDFIIIGKSTKYIPRYLFSSLNKLSQWNHELSDSVE